MTPPMPMLPAITTMMANRVMKAVAVVVAVAAVVVAVVATGTSQTRTLMSHLQTTAMMTQTMHLIPIQVMPLPKKSLPMLITLRLTLP